jgi:hypothetical protein
MGTVAQRRRWISDAGELKVGQWYAAHKVAAAKNKSRMPLAKTPRRQGRESGSKIPNTKNLLVLPWRPGVLARGLFLFFFAADHLGHSTSQ